LKAARTTDRSDLVCAIERKITEYRQFQAGRCRPLLQTPMVDEKTFVFIGRLHRSGNSVLHRLLSEHPQTSGFYDTGVPEDEGQHLQTVYKAEYYYGGPGEFALHPDAHLTEDSALINQNNRGKILREWGAYYDLQKPVLLEKSPPNLVRSRFLRQMFPGSKFVFIVRHPVAVSLATEKWSNKTIAERLLHWHAAHSIMLDDIDSATDCLVLRYEDFIKAPDSYLDEIFDRVGIERFSPSAAVEDHNEKYFLDWQQRSESEVRALQAMLPAKSRVLEHFGYSLTGSFVD
jgi:hypothetical protein